MFPSFPLCLFVNYFILTLCEEATEKPKVSPTKATVSPVNLPLVAKPWSRSSYLPNPTLYQFTPDNVAQRLYKSMHLTSHYLSQLGGSNQVPEKPLASPVQSSKTSLSSNITTNGTDFHRKGTSRKLASKNVSDQKELEVFRNMSLNKKEMKLMEEIYGDVTSTTQEMHEHLKQMSKWMSNNNVPRKQLASNQGHPHDPPPNSGGTQHDNPADLVSILASAMADKVSKGESQPSSSLLSIANVSKPEPLVAEHVEPPTASGSGLNSHKYDRDEEASEENEVEISGSLKPPSCALSGRHFCSYKEDYPIKIVTEVTKYYKWPLEKLFRDLRHQVMPKLANDNLGGLVCDSVTRVIRPGWAKNTNNRWLVIINTDTYRQYVTEIVCRHGPDSRCSFISPCYHAVCKQRYNTQKLLVIDPWNPYKGPFLSEFLFPSCCICYIPAGDRGPSPFGIRFEGPHRRYDSIDATERSEL